jgi:transposase-like protein
MSDVSLLDDVRQAAREYESSEHRLRLAVTAAVAARVPIASVARAAGVTRQTVYNWSTDYGQGPGLTVAAGTHLASLPVQRPQAAKGAPVLILGIRRKGRLSWDGRWGTASGYAGDELGVSVRGKIMDVIAASWALAGNASGVGQRPRTGDRVILEDGVLATVEDSGGDPGGNIRVVADGKLLTRSRWAIVLPGI